MIPSLMQILVAAAIEAREPVLLVGPPGIGKTEIIKSMCTEKDLELILSHPVCSDPTDYRGLPFITNGEARFLPFDDLQRLIDADKPTAFFLDDLGQAPQAVQAAAMQLLLGRQINGHKVADCVTFIAATNRKQDKAGVSGILEPVKSRFTTIVNLEPDLNDWIKWAIKADLPIELIAFIRFRPNLLFDFKPTIDLTNSPCPRTVGNVAKLMAMNLPESIQYEVFAGAAGEGFAAEFVGFLKVFRNMPNPDAVLMNPSIYDYDPGMPAVAYALSTAIARKATRNNMERVVAVANAMPAEFGTIMIRDAINHEPDVVNTKAFIKWTTENQDVLL